MKRNVSRLLGAIGVATLLAGALGNTQLSAQAAGGAQGGPGGIGAPNFADAKRACPMVRDFAAFYACASEKIKTFRTTKRTKEGKPDFNGIWSPTRIANNIEQDGGTKSLIVDPPNGKIPYLPWAQKPREEGHDKWLSPTAACLPVGAVRWAYSPVSVTGQRFIQQPNEIIFSMERLHTYRIIPLDNSRRLASRVKLWQGESRGRWEGDTLVIDTTNLNDVVWFDHIGTFMSDEMKMEERFTYVDPDTLLYVATYTDPKVFSQKWKISKGFLRAPAKGLDRVDLEDTTVEGCEETVAHLIGAGQRTWTGLHLVLPK